MNTMTPFTYAFAQYDEPVYSQEVVEVSDDTADSSAGDSSSETWYEENIHGESPVDFSLNTESQTSAEEQWDTQDSSASPQNDSEQPVDSSLDAQNDDKQTEWSETQDEEPVEFDFSGKSAAAVTKMLGWDWDAESDYYAEVLWIENYRGLPEQNEIIRDYMVNNKSLPQRNVTKENTEDSSNNSEFQDEESDDEDPLPEEWDTEDSLEQGVQNDEQENTSEWEGVEDDKWFFEEIGEGIQNLFDKVRYFFTDEENESYIIYSEDDNNIWTITLKDPETAATITIMDRNLWAEKVNDYGYYFQWWNNHGVEEVNSTNKTNIKAIYDDSFYGKWYDGNGLFIVWAKDYRENGNHYNNLWWWDLKEQYKQAACPAWYHVPTAKEWNQLMSIWWKIHTQDVSVNEEWQNVSQTRYTANSSETKIASFKDQAQQCEESDTQCVDEDSFSDIINILSSELRLPLAGGYDEDGKYYDEWWIYWTSTARDGEKALIFDIDAYFGINGDDNLGYKAQGHNIRCFQNVTERYVEEDTQDSQQTEQAQQAEWTSADASEWQGDTNNNPGSASMTDQDWNGTQNENEVEPGLNVENSSEWQAGDDEQAKTDSDISVLDYLFHEGVGDSASSPFPGDEEDNLEQSFTWEVDNLSWEVLTWEVEELTWEVVELTGTALELATAWEKLNVEPITKAERYNRVTVNVEAPTGTFPEGTYANIRPIVSTTKLDEIKGQISEEDKTVSQESEVVAFDITFMYKLSDGTEVEVQPKENTVKVTFNYEDNDELSKADEIDEQEVKVFHIEEVKDEQWNKTWEEKVNDVTNKEESAEEWIAVADAESFSIYAVITTTAWTDIHITYQLNGWYWVEDHTTSPKVVTYTDVNWEYTADYNYRTPSMDGYMFMWWFDQTWTERRNWKTNVDKTVYAKWKEFWDLDVYILKSDNASDKFHYTLMDRNMWAEQIYNKKHSGNACTVGSNCPNYESYWYYYQWWNNYWFDSYALTKGQLSNDNKYSWQKDIQWYSWDNPYTYFKFVIPTNTNSQYDWMSSRNENIWWWNESDVSHMQWPCPDGYHVPTKYELESIVDNWKAVNTRNGNTLLGQGYGTLGHLRIDFLLPSASYRRRQASDVQATDFKFSRYLTSTPASSSATSTSAYVFKFDNGTDTSFEEEKMANGFSVRCLKNEKNEWSSAIITDIDLDWWQKAIISIAEWKISSLQEPTKTNFVFGGWYTTSDHQIWTKVVEGSSISALTTLYARWKCPDGKTYDANNNCVDWKTITFKSEDGTQELWKTTVLEWENAYYDDVNPTRDPLIDTEYTFAGWTTQPNGGGNVDDLSNVVVDRTVYAHFTESTRKYTITWLDDEGGLIDTTSVEYNTIPTHADAIKEPTVTIEYSFNGWTPTPTLVAGDATYTATFLESPRKYEITWVDGNGDTLKTEQVGYGSTPAYNWDIPTKTATAQYTYTFNNTWIPAIVSVVGDATYTAQFDSAVNKYNITFVDEDGTVLKAATAYDYGTAAADITKPADPTKAKDAQYTYTFAGWSPAVSAVTCEVAADCNKTYTATYTPHIRSYTITWKDGDGETLKTDTVEYGQTPSYNWDTPTKTATAQYTYTFNNTWIPAIVSVVGDATYTAQFDHSTRTYTVTWNNRDGTNLETDQNVPYAAYPHYDWSIPHKQGDATHSYSPMMEQFHINMQMRHIGIYLMVGQEIVQMWISVLKQLYEM